MELFDDFFELATGSAVSPAAAGVAASGLPGFLPARSSADKASVVLAWLWRRLHGPDRVATPRRLIYLLPQGSLVEPMVALVSGWLDRLGLTGEVALQAVPGAWGSVSAGRPQWRQDLHCPAIIIGTADYLLSKALNRGFGIGPAIQPIDFALVTNGAHWVVDEIELCPQAAATLRQLASFAGEAGTAEPFGITYLSAVSPGASAVSQGTSAVSPRTSAVSLGVAAGLAARAPLRCQPD